MPHESYLSDYLRAHLVQEKIGQIPLDFVSFLFLGSGPDTPEGSVVETGIGSMKLSPELEDPRKTCALHVPKIAHYYNISYESYLGMSTLANH